MFDSSRAAYIFVAVQAFHMFGRPPVSLQGKM